MKVTKHNDGTVSLRLSIYDAEVNDILYALDMSALHLAPEKHKPAPHWWGEGGETYSEYCNRLARRYDEMAKAIRAKGLS